MLTHVNKNNSSTNDVENSQGVILFHVDIILHILHISINSYSTLYSWHYKASQLIMAGENLKENLLLLLFYASVTSNHILNIIPTCKCSSLNSTKNLLFFTRSKTLQKATTGQNAKNNWPKGTQFQSIHLKHKHLHLRLRKPLKRRSGKILRDIGPGHCCKIVSCV